MTKGQVSNEYDGSRPARGEDSGVSIPSVTFFFGHCSSWREKEGGCGRRAGGGGIGTAVDGNAL